MLHSLGLDSISEGVQANYFLFPGKSYIVEARVNPIREKEELMKLPHITIDAVKGIDAVATPPRTPDRTTKRSKRINVF